MIAADYKQAATVQAKAALAGVRVDPIEADDGALVADQAVRHARRGVRAAGANGDRGMSLDLQDVDTERRAPVAIDAITAARQHFGREHRRASALTAREALAALQFEALLVWTAAANVRNGVELTDEDMARLTTAMRWIDTICDEVL